MKFLRSILLALSLAVAPPAFAQLPAIDAVAGPSTSAQLRRILTDETGTGVAIFGGGDANTLINLNGSAVATGTVAAARLPNAGVTTINGVSCTIGGICTITASTNSITVGVTDVLSGTSNGLLYNNAGDLGNLATSASGVLVTSAGGGPSISTTLPDGLAMGTPASLTLTNATGLPNAGLVNSSTTVNGQTCTLGSTCTITASVSSLVPGTTTLTGGALNSNGLLSNSGNVLTNLASANNGVLVTNGSGVPSISTTLPNGIAATSMSLTTPTILGALTYGGVTASASTTGTGSLVLSNDPTVNILVPGSTTTLSLQDRFGQVINAADYGASPANPDNTTAINAAIAALSAGATRGGCVVLNKGIFSVSGTITLPSGVSLCGSGNQIWNPGTRLLGTGPSGQILIDIGTGADNPHYNYVQDMAFDFSTPQTSGAVIRVRNGVRITLQRLTFIKDYYDGIVLSGALSWPGPSVGTYDYILSNITMHNFTGTVRRGIWVGAPRGGNPSTVIGLIMSNVFVSGAGSPTMDAVYLQNVGGVQGCVGCEFAGANRALVIAPEDNETVDGVLWFGTYLDGSMWDSLAIVPTGSPGCTPYTSNTLPLCGRASQMSFHGVRPAYSQTGRGLNIDSSGGGLINGLNFIGLEAGLNALEGVRLEGPNTKYINFTNSKISYNNTSNTGKAGVWIGADVSNVTFNGGCVSTCSSQHPDTVNYQQYGFDIQAGASDYIIQGMDLTDNVVGPYFNNGGNLRWSIFNNLGPSEGVIPGPLRIYDRTSSLYSLVIDGINNSTGGASILLGGDGVTTPSKTIRAHGGALQVLNNAYAVVASVNDSGDLTLGSGAAGTLFAKTMTAPAANSLRLNAPTGQTVVQQVNGTGIVQTAAGSFTPLTNNSTELGTNSLRWSSVFGVNGFFSGTLATVDVTVGGTLRTTQASPASGAACNAGQIAADANYLYTCASSGAWKRVAVTGGY